MEPYYFVVGTVNTPEIYVLAFTPSSNTGKAALLNVKHISKGIGSHSWLCLRKFQDSWILYATAWTDPPSLVAYSIASPTDIQLINSVEIPARGGYVCASSRALYYVGGVHGGVFALDPSTGGFALAATSVPAPPLQEISFLEKSSPEHRDDGSVMDFGGLRHGAHGIDLSVDGDALYITDIGANCIWSYVVDPRTNLLGTRKKQLSPRADDGPRHTHPHPGGKVLYCIQEHSSMVDLFEIRSDKISLKHVGGVKIIPATEDPQLYWADEVRTSLSNGSKPKYLFTSARGLESDRSNAEKYRKGWVTAFRLQEDGMIEDSEPLCSWQTPTSGGWANAIQPGPSIDGTEYIALTDTEVGLACVLGWDGSKFTDVARIQLGDAAKAATAVWL